MKKVIVIGSPGAGKSIFSRKLADITALPLHHLDLIWHKPDRTTVSREQFDMCLSNILGEECWIIDGNYARTAELRIAACDTVFLFDLPTELCLEGAYSRLGAPRPDMPWYETELDPELEQFIASFKNSVLPEINKLLEKYKPKNVYIFKLRDEADDFISKLKAKYKYKGKRKNENTQKA